MIRIVLIEDNPADVTLFKEALSFSGISAEVIHVRDGLEAVAACRSHVEPWDPPPDLVFLDLNMPRLSGFEVLAQLKEMPEYASIRAWRYLLHRSPHLTWKWRPGCEQIDS